MARLHAINQEGLRQLTSKELSQSVDKALGKSVDKAPGKAVDKVGREGKPRAEARAEQRSAILAAGRRQLGEVGPERLSLRAVARDVGLVSSAVYRYFASRDELLTALLIDCYGELGQDAVNADAAVVDRSNGRARWSAATGALRDWALAHRHDYALLYGSPVTGYAAPQDTVGPAMVGTGLLMRIIAETTLAAPEPSPGFDTPVGKALRGARESAPEMLGIELDRQPDDQMLLLAMMAWTTTFGAISFELFGHYVGGVSDTDGFFKAAMDRLADDLQLAGPT